MFFLSSSSTSYLWYLFSRIRAMIESNRGRFMYLTVVVVLVLYVCCCRRRRRLSRGTREKSYDEEISTFFIRSRVFSIFPTLIVSPYSPFHCVVVSREYRVRRTRTTTD